MAKRFLLLFGLFAGIVGLVIAAFVWRPHETTDWRPSGFRLDLVEIDESRPIYTQTGLAGIRGYTTAPAFVELNRDGTVITGASTDSAGKFSFEDFPLTPGINNLECKATSSDSNREIATVSVTIIWEPRQPPPPTLDQLPLTLNTAGILIKGKAFPGGSVRIDVQPVNDRHVARKGAVPFFQTDTTAGADGRFEALVRLTAPAKYSFVAISRNSQGTLSKPSAKIETTYDPFWYPDTPPTVTPALPPRRSATVTISHKELSMNFQVVMARDDPAVPALLADELTVSKFFDDTFELSINDTRYRKVFSQAEPQITVTDRLVTVSASSNTSFRDLMPILSGTLKLSIYPLDSLTIITNDYVVKGIKPAPTKLENNTATWVRADDPRSPIDQSTTDREVSIQLDYSPLSSPSRAIRFLRLNPYTLWTYPANIVPTLVYGILNAIPIFWILLVLKSTGGQPLLNANNLTPSLQTLAALSLVDTVWDVVYGVAYLLYGIRVLKMSESAAPELHLLAALLVFAFLLVVRLLVRSQANWTEWLRTICKALLFAALINIALISIFKIEAGYARWVVRTQIVLGSGVLLLISVYVRRLVKELGITFKHPRWWVGLALLVIVVLSIPFGTPPDGYFPRIDVLFYLVRDLAPAIAALVLVVFLKKLGDLREEDAGDWLTQAALIIFCGYLVGATTTLFMVPVPFILSFLAFRKFVITTADTNQKLSAVEASVFQSRRELIDKVIANDAAQAMKNSIDKLADKVASGNLKIDEFKQRAQEIDAYASEHEQAATLAGDLPAEDAVLSLGISPQRWRNAIWAVKFGGLLSLPFLIIYLTELLIRGGLLFGEHYRLLISLTRIITFLAEWLIGAFFFGFFFKSIQGNSGLEKGLRVGCAVVACFLPVWFVSTSTRVELLAIFLQAVQTFLFFTFLGLASDYRIFKETMNNNFSWRLFTRFGDMPSFTAVASVIITSIGVTITTVLTGHFKDLVSQLVGAALSQPGTPHP